MLLAIKKCGQVLVHIWGNFPVEDNVHRAKLPACICFHVIAWKGLDVAFRVFLIKCRSPDTLDGRDWTSLIHALSSPESL